VRQKFFILFILIQTTASAQSKLSFKINNDSLKKIGIDTFFIYKNYCVGCKNGITIDRNATKNEIYEKWCEASDPVFIFYKNQGNIYVNKSNDCCNYKPIRLDTSPTFSYFLKWFTELFNENVLTNSFLSEKGDSIKTYQQHGIVTEMYLSNGRKKELTVDGYDFSEKSMTDKNNINYDHNMKTKYLQLRELTFEELEKLKFSKK